MKQIKKRLVAGFLALLLSCTCILGSYQEVHATGVVEAGYLLMQVMQALLASAGATYITSDMLINGLPDSRPVITVDDLPYIPDDEVEDFKRAYESMNEAWDKQWEEKYGGGNGSGGDEPPKFNDFIRDILSKGVVEYDEDTWDIAKRWYETFMNDAYALGQVAADKILKDKGINVDTDYISADTIFVASHGKAVWPGAIQYDSFMCFTSKPACVYVSGTTPHVLVGGGSVYGTACLFLNGNFVGKEWGCYVSSDTVSINGVSIKIYDHYSSSAIVDYMVFSCPTFNNYEDAKAYIMEQLTAGSTTEEKTTKLPIMVVPALQDSMNNTGTYTLPDEVPQPVSVPTVEQLEALRQQLADEDTKPDTAVENFIEQLKTDTQPTVVPTITVAPTITVTPAPDGDDTDNNDFVADLKEIFPFCVPFDLIRAFKLLSATPEAPVFSIPFKVDTFSFHVDEKWEVDMSDYESVIKIFRVLETIGFVVGLVLITRKLIKG